MPAAQLGRHQEGLFGDLGLRPGTPRAPVSGSTTLPLPQLPDKLNTLPR